MTRVSAPQHATQHGHRVLVPAAPPPRVSVRTALRADAPDICRIVNAWADQGLTLRRTEDEIRTNAGEFVVAERQGHPVGCGALAVFSPALAEIRSIAVDPDCRGGGVSRLVVEFLVDTALVLEIDELVLLTRIPEFFAKFGFREITTEDLSPSFLDETIVGRGRTIAGRTIMRRDLWAESAG